MRGRPRKIPEAIHQHDFARLAKRAKNPRERLRYLAFAHIKEGKPYVAVAAMMKVTYKTVWEWINRFKKEGLAGLKDRPGRGAKPHLPVERREAFQQAVLQLVSDRVGGRIRGKDIAELLEKQFHVKSSLRSVYNTLRTVDLVWITGRSKHPKADLQKQEAFKKTSKKMSTTFSQME